MAQTQIIIIEQPIITIHQQQKAAYNSLDGNQSNYNIQNQFKCATFK